MCVYGGWVGGREGEGTEEENEAGREGGKEERRRGVRKVSVQPSC